MNQHSNRSEPLTKQNDAKSNSGVVGNKGKIIPKMPSPRAKNPIKIKINLTKLFMLAAPFQVHQNSQFLLHYIIINMIN